MYDEFTLPNGLQVIGQNISHFRSVSVGLWVHAGSLYETEAENGLSHMLEHMLFKGTERRNARQIAQEMDSIGGQMNAFTAKECTCYYTKVMDQHLENAVDLLSDLLLHSTLEAGELAKERGVIVEEIAMVMDTPEDLVHELLAEAHFAGQTLARPILGETEHIRAVERPELAAFRDTHYSPMNTVLAVAGNYDLTKLKALAEQYLGNWQNDIPEKETPRDNGYTAQHLFRTRDIEQVHLCMGFPGVPSERPETYAMSVFNTLFGGGMSSRLFQRIREESGMAYSVYSYPSHYPHTGMLTIYAGTSEAHAPKVIEMIRQEIDLLLNQGIEEEEFQQAVAQLRGGYTLGLESTSSRMSSIGRGKLLFGRAKSEEEVLAAIDAVKREDVLRVAQNALSSKYSTALVGSNAEALSAEAFSK